MLSTTMSEEKARQEFAVKAAEKFARDDKLTTVGDIKPGGYIALRYGLTDRSVVVVKLSEDHACINYRDLIAEVKNAGSEMDR